jgi:hypothetical protein
MKEHTTTLMIFMLAVLVVVQAPAETNITWQAPDTHRATGQTNAFKTRRGKTGDKEHREKRSQEYSSGQRKLNLMERELKRIGVTEQQKVQIKALQKLHREKMSANAQQIAKARKNLSGLLDEGASMEVLEAAIQDVAEAQADQLRILVQNRLEMERILGKEKNDEFMQKARAQFEKHGRRGGPPLPPRPGLHSQPGQQEEPPIPKQKVPPVGENP